MYNPKMGLTTAAWTIEWLSNICFLISGIFISYNSYLSKPIPNISDTHQFYGGLLVINVGLCSGVWHYFLTPGLVWIDRGAIMLLIYHLHVYLGWNNVLFHIYRNKVLMLLCMSAVICMILGEIEKRGWSEQHEYMGWHSVWHALSAICLLIFYTKVNVKFHIV